MGAGVERKVERRKTYNQAWKIKLKEGRFYNDVKAVKDVSRQINGSARCDLFGKPISGILQLTR